MAIKNIVIYLDLSSAHEESLHFTLQLARRFEAFVIGVLTLPPVGLAAMANTGPTAVGLSSQLAELAEQATAIAANLNTALRRHNCQASFIKKPGWSPPT